MTHALKTWPDYYAAIVKGEKTFDLRKEDRPFKVGDTVLLQEFNHKEGSFTGAETSMKISYILKDVPKFGLKNGFCILGLQDEHL